MQFVMADYRGCSGPDALQVAAVGGLSVVQFASRSFGLLLQFWCPEPSSLKAKP